MNANRLDPDFWKEVAAWEIHEWAKDKNIEAWKVKEIRRAAKKLVEALFDIGFRPKIEFVGILNEMAELKNAFDESDIAKVLAATE